MERHSTCTFSRPKCSTVLRSILKYRGAQISRYHRVSNDLETVPERKVMYVVVLEEICSGKGLLEPTLPLLPGLSEVLRATDDFTMYCAV
jgi:hypothetical protein